MRKLNYFERKGLANFINECCEFGIEDVSNFIMGTTTNELINIDNVEVYNNFPEGFPMLGAFGLTEGEDIVFEYWDIFGEEHVRYIISRTYILSDDHWMKDAYKYDVKKGEIIEKY